MNPLAKLLCALIRLYQKTFRLLLGNCCRFEPSCSNYMLEAIRTHGVGYGVFWGLRRIARCHPWNPGGYDPVPPKSSDVKRETKHE